MGPSGYGFLHPAAIASNESLLTEFVNSTVDAAEQLSMTSYVHWDIDDNGLTQRCLPQLLLCSFLIGHAVISVHNSVHLLREKVVVSRHSDMNCPHVLQAVNFTWCS